MPVLSGMVHPPSLRESGRQPLIRSRGIVIGTLSFLPQGLSRLEAVAESLCLITVRAALH